MCDEFRWKSFEWLWPASKRPNPRGDNHPARLQLLAVSESYSEALGTFLDAGDSTAIDLRDSLAVKPKTVFNKPIERNWRRNSNAELSSKRVHGERCSGI